MTASPEAARDIARRLEERGDFKGALTAYLEAIDSGDPQHAPAAARDLGDLLRRRRYLRGARAAYQVMIGPADSAQAVGALRLLRGLMNDGAHHLDEPTAHGPAIPAVFDEPQDPQLDRAAPAEEWFKSPIISRRIADVLVLIGAGELTAAETELLGWCAEEEKSRARHEWVRWPFTALFRIYEARGDLSGAAAILRRYRACDRFADEDKLVALLEEGLAHPHAPAERRGPIFPWGGDNDVLSDAMFNGDQFHDAGVFFRPLPHPAAGGARFVLVGGPMCHIDRRGEHSCTTGDPVEGPEAERLAENTARVFALTESPTWTAAAVELSHRLLGAAQRCGEPAAWAVATGFIPTGFRATLKALGAPPPTNLNVEYGRRVRRKPARDLGLYQHQAASFVLRKPARGAWLYHHQPATYVIHQHAPDRLLYQLKGDPPRVALWRWPDRSDLILHAWCDTLVVESPSPVTVVLPDTPMLRDFARRYVRRQPMDRIGRTYLENAVHFGGMTEVPDLRGSACYLRARPSLVVDADGTEWDGDLLTVALDYLETHYHLRISPFDALRDPLLSSLFTDDFAALQDARDAEAVWRPDELEQFRRMRNVYSPYRTRQAPAVDLYSIHEPVSYAP